VDGDRTGRTLTACRDCKDAPVNTSRLEAFSDGVLAIIITIMVLELKVPEGHTFTALRHAAGTGILTYLLSFVYIGIYWNNHHHMFQLTERVTGAAMWANLNLLFWLSLYPFTTGWMDESKFAGTPVVVYGVNLLAAAVAWKILQTAIVRGQPANARLAEALGRDVKGLLSPVLYVAGIVAGAFSGPDARAVTWIAMAFYVAVAVMWLVPDRRFERAVTATNAPHTTP
jgi:uncharacterized membrane protein